MFNKNNNHLPDGRKFRLAILSLVILVIMILLSIPNPGITGLISELITGILGINIIYNGGNVTNKWVIKKEEKALENKEEDSEVVKESCSCSCK